MVTQRLRRVGSDFVDRSMVKLHRSMARPPAKNVQRQDSQTFVSTLVIALSGKEDNCTVQLIMIRDMKAGTDDEHAHSFYSQHVIPDAEI